MSWLKMDDAFPSHSKVIGLSHRAFRLHVTALCHAAQNLTDGLITRQALVVVGAISGRGKKVTDELEAAALWVPVLTGWKIHGYLDLNPSKERVKELKAAAKANAEKRWRGAGGNADRIAIGSAEPNALPSHPIPLALANPSSALNYERLGVVSQTPLENLKLVCGPDSWVKLDRAARGLPEAALVAALEACRGPNVRDRVAVALSELKKRRAA